MKLKTKRNLRYFLREVFSYMIPMILIVWTIDVFVSFIKCSVHPERSAPCSINWILAAIYWFFLLVTIFFAIISARMLRKIKKQIENEFTESVDSYIETKKSEEEIEESEETKEDTKKKETRPRKIIVKKNKKSENKDTTDKKVSKKTTTKKSVAKK